MNRIQIAIAGAVVVATVALEPAAEAQTIKSGRTLTVSAERINFPKPVTACLKMCLDVVVERHTFECQAYLIPGEGCDLPGGADWDDPNPDPTGQCVPPESEFGGWHLSERREVIEKRVTQRAADCTATVSETVLQTLPNLGNPPRPCPDNAGWTSIDETVQSIRFVPCP